MKVTDYGLCIGGFLVFNRHPNVSFVLIIFLTVVKSSLIYHLSFTILPFYGRKASFATIAKNV